MPASPHLSLFERHLIPIKSPVSIYNRLYHPTFPATHLLSLLSLPSKLALRCVSPTTKTWIDFAYPSVFSNLSLLFPLNTVSKEELHALHTTATKCEHLTVTVLSQDGSSSSVRDPNDVTPLLPAFPRLKHLHLIAPDHNHDSFHPLLSFRLALQSASLPLLTHLSISNLSFQGVLALRWGGFTSFADAGCAGADVWRGLTEMDVQLCGWWEEYERRDFNREESEVENETETETEISLRNAQRQEESWRSCTRLLHDWLHSFAANTHLHTLRFEYSNNGHYNDNTKNEGPNPFLLDEISSLDGRKHWFSAPRISWPDSLKEVWLGDVVVTVGDVRRLKERMGGLERLVVWAELLDVGLGGRRVGGDGFGGDKVWVELDVKGHRVGEWRDVLLGGKGTVLGKEEMRGSWCEGAVGGDRVSSMVLPFMLELSPEDGEFL